MPYFLKNFDWYALKLGLKPALTLEYSDSGFPAFSRQIPALEREGFLVHCRDIARDPLRLQRVNTDSLSASRSRYQIFISRRREIIEALLRAYDTPDLAAIGRLLGYPRCCVAAYEKRAGSVLRTRPPYLSVPNDLLALGAPVAARHYRPESNFLLHYDGRVVNAKIMAIPAFKKIFSELFPYSMADHYPCSVACQATARRGALVRAALERADPEWSARAVELAGSPVLYLGNFRFFILAGAARGRARADYSRVIFSGEAGAESPLGAALSRGDRVEVSPGEARVFGAGRLLFRARAPLPGPCLLPFSH